MSWETTRRDNLFPQEVNDLVWAESIIKKANDIAERRKRRRIREEGEEADVDFEEMWGPQHVVHQAISMREEILKKQETRRKKKKEKEENENKEENDTGQAASSGEAPTSMSSASTAA